MDTMTVWPTIALPENVTHEPGEDPNYGKFVIGPFEQGIGTALGNSMRRILLSTLEGTAVATLKIDGVLHEFSTIPDVYEDVTEIILNIKKLRVRLHNDGPELMVVEKTGVGPILGSDIQESATAEVITRDVKLCELCGPEPFRMELLVKKGRGFITADENCEEDQEIGVIPVDSNFSPVETVRFKVEPVKGSNAAQPLETLTLELWTDGTISPQMAVVEAAKIMRKHLNPFIRYYELEQLGDDELTGDGREDVSAAQKELDEKLDRPVMELDLSVRASNCMTAEKIVSIRDLVVRSEADLLRIRNFGKTTLVEVKKKLTELGLTLNMDV